MNLFIRLSALLVIVLAVASLSWKGVIPTLLGKVYNTNGYSLFNLTEKDKKKKAKEKPASIEIKVVRLWELPPVLKEISGVAYLSPNRFACVQDEMGIIYIYNTMSEEIEQEIPFGEPGDFEGITVVGKTAYVIRSDGKIYEVDDITSTQPKIEQYSTFLTVDQDVEGICYDAKHKRLLISIKGNDPNSQHYKGVYAFDIVSKKMNTQPVYQLALNDPQFDYTDVQKAKGKAVVQPSDIEVNPITGDIYLTEAVHHQLIILDSNGSVKKVYQTGNSIFAKPEGITFTSSGELFISNEGKKGNANIVQVEILEQES